MYLTWIEVGLSMLVSVSIGTAILLVPSLRVATGSLERQGLHESLGPRHCATGRPGWFGSGLLLLPERPSGSPLPSALGVAQMWDDHVARLVAFTPWLGDRLTNALWNAFGTSLYRPRQGDVSWLCVLVDVASTGVRPERKPS